MATETEGMYFNCTALFEQAKAACSRIPSMVSDHEPRQKDALTSIVLASASLEGFINEAVELAQFPEGTESDATRNITAWTGVLEELEFAHARLQSKYLMTKFIFSGEPFDKGMQPYQDFNLLLELRNSVMHLKALDRFRQEDGISGRVKHPIIERLRSRNILGKSIAVPPITFIDMICTRATARWACASAAAMITTIIDITPRSGLQGGLAFLRQWFRLD